jgi:hypothetical protein
MGSVYQAKSVVLMDGNVLPASTVLIGENFVVYISPKSGRYSEIYSWNAIKRIVLVEEISL